MRKIQASPESVVPPGANYYRRCIRGDFFFREKDDVHKLLVSPQTPYALSLFIMGTLNADLRAQLLEQIIRPACAVAEIHLPSEPFADHQSDLAAVDTSLLASCVASEIRTMSGTNPMLIGLEST